MSGKDDKALQVLSRINGLAQAKVILSQIKATAEEKTEKLFTYGWMVIFIGIMLSVFQQAVGINAVLYFAPRILRNDGNGQPDRCQTVIMGTHQYSVHVAGLSLQSRNGDVNHCLSRDLSVWR